MCIIVLPIALLSCSFSTKVSYNTSFPEARELLLSYDADSPRSRGIHAEMSSGENPAAGIGSAASVSALSYLSVFPEYMGIRFLSTEYTSFRLYYIYLTGSSRIGKMARYRTRSFRRSALPQRSRRMYFWSLPRHHDCLPLRISLTREPDTEV